MCLTVCPCGDSDAEAIQLELDVHLELNVHDWAVPDSIFFAGVGGGGRAWQRGNGRESLLKALEGGGVNKWASCRTTRIGDSEDPTNYRNLPKSDFGRMPGKHRHQDRFTKN